MSNIEKLVSLVQEREAITSAIEAELRPHVEVWLTYMNVIRNPTPTHYHQLSFLAIEGDHVKYQVDKGYFPPTLISFPIEFMENRSAYFDSMDPEGLEQIVKTIDRTVSVLSNAQQDCLETLDTVNREIAHYENSLV